MSYGTPPINNRNSVSITDNEGDLWGGGQRSMPNENTRKVQLCVALETESGFWLGGLWKNQGPDACCRGKQTQKLYLQLHSGCFDPGGSGSPGLPVEVGRRHEKWVRIPTKRLRKEDAEFQVHLDYILRPCGKNLEQGTAGFGETVSVCSVFWAHVAGSVGLAS